MRIPSRILLPVVLLTALLPLQGLAGTLLLNQVAPYLGYGYGLYDWDGMTADLNAAFGAGNITVGSSPLTDLGAMLAYDALWVTARQPGDALSAAEIANIASYIATGRRAILVGENSAWSAWNATILSPVGGSFSGGVDGAVSVALTHPLTAGITSLETYSDGTAVGGTSLFSENVATLWGGSQNVLTVLSINIMDDLAAAGNAQFNANMASWLAAGGAEEIPEPATFALVGLALASLPLLRRRRS